MIRFDVLGVGENSVDHVYRLPHLPGDGPASKIRIAAHARRAGGQVATTLSACAALGLSAAYAGVFGEDADGRFARVALEQSGVDLRHALTRQAPNRYAVILVAAGSGERIVLWDRDAAMSMRPDEVTPAMVSAARLVHVDAVDEAVSIHVARMARDAGVPVTSDIDAVTDRTRELMAAVTVPVFAEEVPAALTGEPDLERALRVLRREHDGLLFVTRGAKGAVLLAGDQFYEQPSFPVQPVDTTGAGDVFRAGVIYGVLRGDAPEAVLRFATAAAALSCTREGALGSGPTLAEVNELLNAGATSTAPTR